MIHRRRHNSNQLRIIGGRWRGRQLSFPPLPTLRPTPDRIRETLFNWLAPNVQNSYCLDLFAGSGALGLEALSRGAAHVTFVDRAPRAIQALKLHLQQLQATAQSTLHCATFPQLKLTPPQPFDIVFLDPPFKDNLLPSACHWLHTQDMLASHAFIYVEIPHDYSFSPPPQWRAVHQKLAGRVAYSLWQVNYHKADFAA